MNKDQTRPVPSKKDVLARLKALQLPISEVIDVGVRDSTPELISAFPGLKHHLFEPVSVFYPLIAKNYRTIDHELHRVALSDADSTQFLNVRSLEKNGVATHGDISDKPAVVDGHFVISCEPLDVRRFDSLSIAHKPDYLLKVDVDGMDLQVLKGFGAKLQQATAIVVEATYSSFLDRLRYLHEQGFDLFDLVDLVYYGSSIYQLDAVFVRRNMITHQVRPPIQRFESALWQPFTP